MGTERPIRSVPPATPPVGHRKLCIGMATYEDFDGVYFTVQALRWLHPEVMDDCSFLVIDNHPEGLVGPALEGFSRHVPNLRYLPFQGYNSTAVRDLVFREADADIVLCLDSHVLVQPGGVAALLAWFESNPESLDIVQGPLLDDSLDWVAGDSFLPIWDDGMYGKWGKDDRCDDPGAPAYEIPMQGLGLFACRKEAWPGINPRFRGFGAEEGYLQERFRQQGGRALCLPALRWCHRFERPTGVPYSSPWEDRIRNYLIGWNEVGWDTAPIREHFTKPGYAQSGSLFDLIDRQLASPLLRFDGVMAINANPDVERWDELAAVLDHHDVGWRIERVPLTEADRPGQDTARRAGVRAAVEAARLRRFDHVLLLGDHAPTVDAGLERLLDVLRDGRAVGAGGAVWSVPGVAVIPAAAFDDVIAGLSDGAATSRAGERVIGSLLLEPPLDARFVSTNRAVSQALLRTLRSVDRLLEERGIPYVAIGGTLLGAERHGGFVPWDDDVDLAVREDHLAALGEEFLAALAGEGLGMSRRFDGMVKVFPLDGLPTDDLHRYPWVDLWPMTLRPHGWVIGPPLEREAWPDDLLELHDFDRARRVPFDDGEVLAPPTASAHRYLCALYGERWASELKYEGHYGAGAVPSSVPSWRGSTARPVRDPAAQVREVRDGAVVRFPGHDLVHRLNPTAALVLAMSDGRRTIGEIAAELQAAYGLSEAPLGDVSSCVRRLRGLGVLR